MTQSLQRQYFVIFLAVSSYWIVSISLVFLNKYLLSSPDLKLDAPLFVTWYQCVVAVCLCLLCSHLSQSFPNLIKFPLLSVELPLCWKIMPLSVVFVGMISFNNLCLKHVTVSFYYLGRCLATVFNVICTYLILGQSTSIRALFGCALIISGFFLGVDQEDELGTLSVAGVVYGVLSSLFLALTAIYIKKLLPVADNSVWRLTMYNNLNASFLFLPIMLVNGEFMELWNFESIFSPHLWTMLSISGLFGFVMGYVSGWQIQVTSALTHIISGTAKAATQTVMAVAIWQEAKSTLWWFSNIVVLIGSASYTYAQKQDMDKKFREVRSLPTVDPRKEELGALLTAIQTRTEFDEKQPANGGAR